MKSIVVFGAGMLGESLKSSLSSVYDVVVVDNNYSRYEQNGDMPVLNPACIADMEYEYVLIASSDPQQTESIYRQLIEDMKINESKVVRFFWSAASFEIKNFWLRIHWLEQFSTFCKEKNIEGSIAEVGVLHGDYSQFINSFFADRPLYLFDTFEGYDERDLADESANNTEYTELSKSLAAINFNRDTSVEKVFAKLPHPENVQIKKGYFPETFDVDDKFCFVFLDLNLYAPTKSGLELFFPRLVHNGVILVHDYFLSNEGGVRKAVDEFCAAIGHSIVPLGDALSVLLIKQ